MIAMFAPAHEALKALKLNGSIRQVPSNHFIDLSSEGVDPQRRCDPEHLTQARLIEPRVVGPLRFGGKVGGPDWHDAFSLERDTAGFEALDDRRCKAVPTGLPGACEMDKAA